MCSQASTQRFLFVLSILQLSSFSSVSAYWLVSYLICLDVQPFFDSFPFCNLIEYIPSVDVIYCASNVQAKESSLFFIMIASMKASNMRASGWLLMLVLTMWVSEIRAGTMVTGTYNVNGTPPFSLKYITRCIYCSICRRLQKHTILFDASPIQPANTHLLHPSSHFHHWYR